MRNSKVHYILPRKYTKVGEYLKELREEANLTQREVSVALGYSSAQFISNFERGIAIPPLKKLKILLRLYQFDIDRFIDLVQVAERAIMQEVLGESRRRRYSSQTRQSTMQRQL